MASVFDRMVRPWWPEFQALTERVNRMEVKQTEVDEAYAAIKASLTDLEADVAKLVASQGVGSVMSEANFATLKSIGERTKALAGVYDSTTTEPTPEV